MSPSHHSCHSGSDINVLRLPMTLAMQRSDMTCFKPESTIPSTRTMLEFDNMIILTIQHHLVSVQRSTHQRIHPNLLSKINGDPSDQANSCTRQHDVEPTPVAQEAYLALTLAGANQCDVTLLSLGGNVAEACCVPLLCSSFRLECL